MEGEEERASLWLGPVVVYRPSPLFLLSSVVRAWVWSECFVVTLLLHVFYLICDTKLRFGINGRRAEVDASNLPDTTALRRAGERRTCSVSAGRLAIVTEPQVSSNGGRARARSGHGLRQGASELPRPSSPSLEIDVLPRSASAIHLAIPLNDVKSTIRFQRQAATPPREHGEHPRRPRR